MKILGLSIRSVERTIILGEHGIFPRLVEKCFSAADISKEINAINVQYAAAFLDVKWYRNRRQPLKERIECWFAQELLKECSLRFHRSTSLPI